jgi:hypothetical protein
MEKNIFDVEKIDTLWRSKEGSLNSKIIEAIYVGIDKNLVMSKIVGSEPKTIIRDYLKLGNETPEEVIASVNLIGNSEAENENEVLASLIDILALKKTLIYIFEKQKNVLHSKLKIEEKELNVFKSDSKLQDIKFEEVCSKLLVAIFNIENLLLVSLDNIISFGSEDLSLVNSGIIFDYNVFNTLITNLAERKSKSDLDGEFNNFSQIIYYYIINALNFHLLSQTNKHSLNGDVVLTSMMQNHAIQKTLPDFDSHTLDFIKESMKDISLNFSLFLKFLNTEIQSKTFVPTKTNPKQIRAEILANKIKIQEAWVKELNPDRNIQEIKYKQFINALEPRKDFYDEALDFFLASYGQGDFESIFIENFEYIENEFESFSFSGNIANYKNICTILKAPFLDKVEEKVLSIIKNYTATLSKDSELVEVDDKIESNQFQISDLPEYFSIDQNSINDFYKKEFFSLADQRYIQNIIQILIDTKVENTDDLLYKYLYLKNCLHNPARNNLPPKRIKTLNSANKVRGMSKIPSTHFRIRVNQRGRMIIGLDQINNKITLITTDDHNLLN